MDPTQEQGRDFVMRGIYGQCRDAQLVALPCHRRLLDPPRARACSAGHGRSGLPSLHEHTLPFLKASGGEVLFYGQGGAFLVGPSNERWDAVMLVRQSSVASFIAFASNQGYLAGSGIRLHHWKIHDLPRSCRHKPEARCGRCRRRSDAEGPLRSILLKNSVSAQGQKISRDMAQFDRQVPRGLPPESVRLT